MRCAILSDIHGNLPALNAVFADMDEQDIDYIFYLGDAVGYGADFAAVIACLHEKVSSLPCRADGRERVSPIWLAGNHEWGLLGRADERLFSQDALTALQRTRAELSRNEQTLLAQLPQRIELQLEDLQITLTHASARDPVGTMHYIDNAAAAGEDAALIPGQLGLVGHTHQPSAFYENGLQLNGRRIWTAWDMPDGSNATFTFATHRAILNPGSVGQPRDGDPRAAYALLDVNERNFTVRRVPYNIHVAQFRLRNWIGDRLPNIDTPGGLAGRLAVGL